MNRRSFLGLLGLAPIGAALPQTALAARPAPPLSPQHLGPARLRIAADDKGRVVLNITALPERMATIRLRRNGELVFDTPSNFYMYPDGSMHGIPTFHFVSDHPGPGVHLYEVECTNGYVTVSPGL